MANTRDINPGSIVECVHCRCNRFGSDFLSNRTDAPCAACRANVTAPDVTDSPTAGRYGMHPSDQAAFAASIRGTAPVERPSKHVTCGCCSDGCRCKLHADATRGLPVAACAYHAALPYAPLDRCFRYDVSISTYIRVPIVK